MQKSETAQTAKTTRRQVKSSTTLNRRYLRRPTNKVDVHPMQVSANVKMQSRQTSSSIQSSRLTAKELKDQAIKKALALANKQPANQDTSMTNEGQKGSMGKLHFGFGRVVLALACATVAVFAIVYFVNLSMPDITLRVAAMQTGIDAAYPSYVPRDYKLTNILSENGKITLNFKNYVTDEEFTLVEEKSSWDSNALLENYVKTNYGNDYSTIREQGLTMYMNSKSATWVNGGVMYEIKTSGYDTLTKKQITTIANSL